VTVDPHTLNSGPGEALCAPESASTPAAGISGGSGAPRGAQTGVHGFQCEREAPDALAIAIARQINTDTSKEQA
jgi:hypothetical protein